MNQLEIMQKLILYSLLVSSSFAFQFPFKVPFFKSKDAIIAEQAQGTPRIAIIGAGAGGSSAAFWISKAKERFGIDVEIDVYERAGYVGGRSTTVYPYNDTSLAPVELGASIFVDANKNLMRASKEFNLSLSKFEDEDSDTGIWDGEHFVLVMSGGGYVKSWWSTVKVLWRYGYSSPSKTNSLVQDMISRFIGLYTTESPRWDNVADLAAKFDWTSMANQTTADYFESKGVSPRFTRELIEAATRVNYGQNIDEIHALEGACSMAASGASGVSSGNYHIFEHFLEKSGAKVYLNTNVKEIKHQSDTSLWTLQTDAGSKVYKGVILAAPFHQSGIKLPFELSSLVPPQPYVHLHVTLLSTRSRHPNPEYFGLSTGTDIPKMILTTYEGARIGGFEPEFNSLSYHGLTRQATNSIDEDTSDVPPQEWVVKIFSKAALTDEWLKTVFGHVGWVYRKEWDAYPKLPPTNEFPPVKLEQGFYYVNAFEPFISTMETETIASRNVVDLLLHEEFGSGICGALLSGPNSSEELKTDPKSDDFVLGWDC
ncbi:FAD/NAD(P)-binding domain-containing protein [Hygrophoropsis aurantiaca]|uniref:FAD/NAD(P)-binding domain-containing protein n=1 Tax=Hygrophoropsis aurantiaca TaxID=72124 RepID=A0ACB8ABT2_9AGAM|nr:FAD/NAD(P)-binding domain-containing protein [Hygrophoropsis aurantiaca]